MASTDAPRGFHPVAKFDGSPYSGLIRSAGVLDGADCFLFDALEYTSGRLGTISATGDTIVGVAVGFGRNVAGMHGGAYVGPFNPRDLEKLWYDDSENTHTEWTVYYVPAKNVVFEGQQDDGTDLVVGANHDIVGLTAGSTVTGISGMEIDGSSTATGGFTLMKAVPRPDQAATDANADWLGFFTTTYNN
ncbi:hypothetical protein KC963_00060 [Candidatus Saccharibacteria bacterium]|nr:hypothetical protein [Candidatus Saccharibacteria bacterium]